MKCYLLELIERVLASCHDINWNHLEFVLLRSRSNACPHLGRSVHSHSPGGAW